MTDTAAITSFQYQVWDHFQTAAATLERLGLLINDERLPVVLDDLVAESLVRQTASGYQL